MKEQAEIAHDDDEGKGDETMKEEEQSVYSFGIRYYYWDFYKNHKWYIPKKYESLKEELKDKVTKSQWDRIMTKAENLMKSNVFGEMRSYRIKNYKVNRDEPINRQHLLALLLYTDYSELSYEFSRSFRKIPTDKSDEDTKKRNMEYREWSRILRYL